MAYCVLLTCSINKWPINDDRMLQVQMEPNSLLSRHQEIMFHSFYVCVSVWPYAETVLLIIKKFGFSFSYPQWNKDRCIMRIYCVWFWRECSLNGDFWLSNIHTRARSHNHGHKSFDQRVFVMLSPILKIILTMSRKLWLVFNKWKEKCDTQPMQAKWKLCA